MKTGPLPRLLLVVALMICLAVPATASSPVETLLGQVPASAFEAGHISYVDYHALVAARPGATAPTDTKDIPAFQTTPEGKVYFKAMQGAASGSSTMIMYLYLADEMKAMSGINPFLMAQSLEAGAPPSQQVWLQGGLDTEAVITALKQQNYQASGGTEQWTLWCEDGACGNGQRTDFSRRDPAFLFGGDLGRRWPVVLGEDLLASSPDSEVILQIAAADGPSLLDLPEVKDVLTSVRSLPDADQVTQFQVFSAATLFVDSQQVPGVVGLFQLDSPEAQRVVLALRYPDPAGAKDALTRFEANFPSAELTTGQPLVTVVENQSGSLEPLSVYEAEGGSAVLIIPFLFPSETAAATENPDSQSAVPFALFRNMALKRDMDWLTR